MSERVVVTGVGPVASIGIGAREFTAALRAGRSGISRVRSFDVSGFARQLAGEVDDFTPAEHLRRLEPKQWGRTSTFAAVAARIAVEDAGLDLDGARTAVAMGTTSGEGPSLVDLVESWEADGFGATPPLAAEQLPSGRIAAAVNRELGLNGPALTVATACAASNYTLGIGYDLIRSGRADLVIAGGADSVTRFTHAGFHRLGALAERHCAPFDRDRDGMLTAEGGAALVLEPYAAAVARGARIYAEVLGYGMTCDALHPVSPDIESIARCMRTAHERAGVRPEQVDYICAHGTGTKTNDRVESLAVAEVFGDRRPPMSSIKSMLGHTMGAASGFGAIACALGIAHDFMPPTINFATPDPEFDWVDPVPHQARAARLNVVQNNGFAFGGNNAIVMLGRVA